MHKNAKTALTLALALVLVAACATDDPNRRTKNGAAIGAVAGAVIGNQSSSKNGKFVGAAVGALTGAAVGQYMDRQQRKMEEQLAREQSNREITLTRLDEETLRLDVSSQVSFDSSSDRIKPAFESTLSKVGAVIGEYDRTAVHVIGHTDSTGSLSYNQQLSERRARSVGDALKSNGVDRRRLRVGGRGELAPSGDNTTKAGRSQNRRVEIFLKSVVEGREQEAFVPPV